MGFGNWVLFRHSDLEIRIFNSGFGLVEIIIVSAIILTALVGFLQVETTSLRLLRAEKDSLEATFLAQEGLEAARALRDEDWSSVASTTNGAVYYPVITSGQWALSSSSSTAGVYTRTLIFNQVLRNAQDEISSSGTLDYGTRQVVSTVSWNTPQGNSQIQLTDYLTNFQTFLMRQSEIKKVSYEGQDTDSDLISFPSNSGLGDPAQSFTTPSSAIKLTKLELYIRKSLAIPSPIYAEIRASATSTPLGFSAIVNSSTIPNSLSWVEFRFPSQVVLNASTLYYIRLRSLPDSTVPASGASGAVIWGYKQISDSPYSGGAAWRYIGAQGNPSDTGQVLTQYDFGFKVYGLQ